MSEFLPIFPFIGIFLLGYFFMTLFMRKDKGINNYLIISMAGGIGIGIFSVIYMLLHILDIYSLKLLFTLETLFITPFFLKYLYFLKHKKITLIKINIKSNLSLYILFSCVTIFSSLSIFYLIANNPYGRWDAWAIWNLKARFLYRGDIYWQNLFSQNISWSHPDYPLLLPSTIAGLWDYYGQENFLIPIYVSLIFAIMTVFTLMTSLCLLKKEKYALLAGTTLLLSPIFLLYSMYQYADIPLGFYYLITFVLITLFYSKKNFNYLILAGITSSFSSFTKNEGLLFIIIISLIFIIKIMIKNRVENLKSVLFYFLGVIPVLILNISVKIKYSLENDVISDTNINLTFEKFFNLLRHHKVIIESINNLFSFSNLFLFFPLFILIGLFLFIKFKKKYRTELENKERIYTPFFILISLTLGYYFIYIITPNEIAWHINTSQDRLLLQLWPSVIFLFFLYFPKTIKNNPKKYIEI